MNSRSHRLSPQGEQLIHRFREHFTASDPYIRTLQFTIGSSEVLSEQLDQAVRSGTLRRIDLLDHTNAVGEYHATLKTIKLSASILTSPGMIAFILGHEAQHALNSCATADASRAFYQDVRRAAATTQDYTMAAENLIKASRWDEATANLGGWNALVDHARGVHRRLWIGRVLRKVPRGTLTDFIDDRGSDAFVHPEFETNPDLSIDMSPQNIEAMAQRFFDKDPEVTGIGGGGTSDYANYYAAWAVGQAAKVHTVVSPRQPMRIDLASLGLSRKLMEESGIDLAGSRQQTYIDASTHPPTRDAFHHTIGTFSYVPPTTAPVVPAQDPTSEAARLAAIGFAFPPTDATRAPTVCGSSSFRRPAPAGVRRRPRLATVPSWHPELPAP